MAVQGENSLHLATMLDNSGLKRGVLDAVGMVQGMSRQIARIHPFAGLAIAAATAFMAISRNAYKLSKEFQHAMKEVETISAATQRSFQKISAEVFKLSKISPDSPVKLANAFYQIVSSGYDGAKGLNLLEVAAKSATAGVTDTMTAADGLTTIMNAFKISAEESEHVADVMFQTVKLGKTNFSELAANIATVAPIAAANGIAFENVMAAVATLTKQGTPTAQAMTQIRSAIISTNEVLEDGWSKSMSLQEAFQLIHKKANGSQSALREMMGRVEAVNAVLGVSGINANMAAEDLSSYSNVAGAMTEANERMLTSNTNKWEIFGNNIKNQMHGIGESILESSSFIADGLNSMFEEAEDLTGQAVAVAVEFDNMRAELESTNVEFERKKEILTQLKNTYPEYLRSLDLTNIKEGNWADILKEVSSELDKINGKLQKKIELSGHEDDLNDKQKKLDSTNKEISETKRKFHKIFTELQNYAKRNEIEFFFTSADLQEGYYLDLANSLFADAELYGKNLRQELLVLKELAYSLEKNSSKWNIRIDGGLLRKREQQLKAVTEASRTLREEAGRLRDAVDWGKLIDASKSIKSITELSDKLKEVVKTGSILNNKEVEGLNNKIAKRKEVISQLEAIGKITEKNKSELSKYEKINNEEIQKAVEAKRNSLKKVGFKSEEDTDFEDSLKSKEEAYANYERTKKYLGEEYANKQYVSLLKEGEDYRAYLLQRLEHFRGYKKEEAAILEAAEKNKFRGFGNEEDTPLPQKIETIPIEAKIIPPNEQSISDIQARISALESQFNQATTDGRRASIAKQISAEREKLDAMRSVLTDEKSEHQQLFNSINDLTWEQLQSRRNKLNIELTDIRKKLSRELAMNIKNTNKINALKQKEQRAQEDLNAVNEASGRKALKTIGEISGALRDLGDIFSMFGDDETSKLLNQLAGVGEGIGRMASGDYIGGAMQTIKSALTVEIVSDTAKFEAQMEELEKTISKLDRAISKAFGRDRTSLRIESMAKQKELEKKALEAKEAEKAARKEVKLLGLRIGRKGKGSGTDPAKLKKLQEEAEEARRKYEDLKDELNEIMVGTAKETVVEKIIADLEKANGKAKDFKKTFNELMREMLKQNFKRMFLEEEMKAFYKKWAEFADNEGGKDGKGDGVLDMTKEEVKKLKKLWQAMTDRVQARYKELEELGQELGIEDGKKNKKGLTGEITTKITEETGSLLAGIARAKLAELKTISQNTILHTTALNQIAKNTSHNRLLVDVVAKLKNIEEALS